ncbi:MAG: phosphoglycerate dehydrogenase [Pseudomonadota bacterium]
MSKLSKNKDAIKIVLLEGIHQNAVKRLNQDGYSNVEYFEKALSNDQLLAVTKDAHFIGIRSRTQLTSEIFANAERLVGVGCFCIGTNQVDLKAAQDLGVPVFNAPFANTRSVAELVLAEAILLLRGIPAKNSAAHRGEWQKTASGSFETRGKTLGIIGYGHIGTQLGILAENLGMQVIFYDIENKLSLGNAQAAASLQELLAKSDVVSLHVPQTPQTHEMIGAQQLSAMKSGSILINASRGTVVQIEALANAIANKKLSGAAIDVFPVEPKSNKDEFVSPLREFDNVILTPHIGGSTQEAQANIGIEVSEKLIKYSNNGSTITAVNFPEVSLPTHEGNHRVMHIHRNEPGILRKVNDILSDNNVNIASQYLQTNEKMGYVVTDIAPGHDEDLINKLRAVEGTIRSRILF